MSAVPIDALRSGADAEMAACLEARGFRRSKPDPRVAWNAFLDFAKRDLPELKTTCIGFEITTHDDRGDEFFLSFVRQMETGEGLGFNCGCVLTCEVPSTCPGGWSADWWWSSAESFEEWLARANSSVLLRFCLEMTGWRWSDFST